MIQRGRTIRRLSRNQLIAAVILVGLVVSGAASIVLQQWVLATLTLTLFLIAATLISLLLYARLGRTHRRVVNLSQRLVGRDECFEELWRSTLDNRENALLQELQRTREMLSTQQEVVKDLETRSRQTLNVVRQNSRSVEDRLATLELSAANLEGIESSLNRLSEQSNLAERKVMNRLRKDNVFETIRGRLEQTERRLVGIIEEERLTASDRWQTLQTQCTKEHSDSLPREEDRQGSQRD